MSNQTIDNAEGEPFGEAIMPPASGKVSRRLDPGLKRNLKILGSVVFLVVAIIAVVIVRTNAAKKNSADSAQQQTSLPALAGAGAGAGADVVLTQAELDRLQRVQQAESEKARQAGNTFIPQNLPLNGTELPPTNDRGSGNGYNIQNGQQNQGDNQSAAVADDLARRNQLIATGLKTQIERIITQFEPPPSSKAGPYAVPQGTAVTTASATNQTAAAASSSASSAAAAGETLIPGLSIHGAELTSPMETDKTNYLSARVTSGPAAGALLFGTAQVVGTEGVRIAFTQMSYAGKAYVINATGLDVKTSSNAMGAGIDRKIFQRYIIPILGATAQAYMTAVARPAQQVIPGVNGEANIVTPGSTAREAAAAGVAAGLAKATESITYSGPNTAFMPVGSAIGILFSDPVKKDAAK